MENNKTFTLHNEKIKSHFPPPIALWLNFGWLFGFGFLFKFF